MTALSAATAPVRASAQLLKPLQNLTPHQRESVMYWVGGTAPLATNLTTPFFTRLRFEHAGIPDEEVHKNVVQESARQLVSAGTHVATYFGTSALVGLKASKTANKNLWMFLAGTAASFVGYAVIRPLISAELILRWLYPQARQVKSDGLNKIKSSQQAVFSGFLK
jgi:hypothetical protein